MDTGITLTNPNNDSPCYEGNSRQGNIHRRSYPCPSAFICGEKYFFLSEINVVLTFSSSQRSVRPSSLVV